MSIYTEGQTVTHSDGTDYKIIERRGDSYVCEAVHGGGGYVTYRGFELQGESVPLVAGVNDNDPRTKAPESAGNLQVIPVATGGTIDPVPKGELAAGAGGVDVAEAGPLTAPTSPAASEQQYNASTVDEDAAPVTRPSGRPGAFGQPHRGGSKP